MNEDLKRIWDVIKDECERINDKFKLFVTLNTVLSILVLRYIFLTMDSATDIESMVYYAIIIVMYITYILIFASIIPSKKYKYVKKNRKRNGNILSVFEISTYDVNEYIRLLESSGISFDKINDEYKSVDLSMCANILHVSGEYSFKLEGMRIIFMFTGLWVVAFLTQLIFAITGVYG